MDAKEARNNLTVLRQLDSTWADLQSLGVRADELGKATPEDAERYSRLLGRAQHFDEALLDLVKQRELFEFLFNEPSLEAILDDSYDPATRGLWQVRWAEARTAIRRAIGTQEQAIGRLEAQAEAAGKRVAERGRAAVAPAAPEPRDDTPVVNETSREYFVAHEFTPEKTDDLRRAIGEALAGSGFTPYYADNEVKEGHIFTNKILPKIRATRFGIYDLSNPDKANVFMELGAAIALQRPYFIICERDTKLPSDVLGLDRIEYESYVDLTRQLKAKVADALRGRS